MLFRITVFVSLLFAGITAYSQNAHVDALRGSLQGRPLDITMDPSIEGTPYLFDEYRMADLTGVDGQVYTGLKVKLNLMNNGLQFMNEKGEELSAAIQIRKIKFYPFVNEKKEQVSAVIENFRAPINRQGDSVFQVLDSGKISLIKHIYIVSVEEKKYNEAAKKVLTKNEVLYSIDASGEKKKVDRSKSYVLELLNDKKAEVAEFIDKSKFKCKREDELTAVFRYYNSLVAAKK